MIVKIETTVGDIAKIVNGKIVHGDPSSMIKSITSDSREIGEASLFVPLLGEMFDGHDYIEKLSREGLISAYLYMRGEPAGNAAAIKCDETLAALGAMGKHARDMYDPEVIGITGTNGKTTTKEIVYAILGSQAAALKNEKNYNNEIGVPFTLMGLSKEHRFAVIEMGMNHLGEIERLSRISSPDLALITNVGEGHLEYLGSVENVAAAKSEIMAGMTGGSTLIMNRDSMCYETVRNSALERGLKLMTFGLSKNADIYPDGYSLSEGSLTVNYRWSEISVPLYGLHNVYNVMAGLSVAEYYSIDLKDAAQALSGIRNIDGRSQIIDRGYIIINDTYNSNPLSSRYALRSVAEIYKERKKIAVLSDMKELGPESDTLHMETGKEAALCGFSMLLLYGSMAESYKEGAVSAGMTEDSVRIFTNKGEISSFLKNILGDGDVVLVKGSRSMRMEEVVDNLVFPR